MAWYDTIKNFFGGTSSKKEQKSVEQPTPVIKPKSDDGVLGISYSRESPGGSPQPDPSPVDFPDEDFPAGSEGLEHSLVGRLDDDQETDRTYTGDTTEEQPLSADELATDPDAGETAIGSFSGDSSVALEDLASEEEDGAATIIGESGTDSWWAAQQAIKIKKESTSKKPARKSQKLKRDREAERLEREGDKKFIEGISSKYKDVKFLAAGGMGKVYKVRDVALDRDVVVKLIRPQIIGEDLSKEVAMEKFQTEAKALVECRGKGVLTVLDFDQKDGQFYMINEFLKEGSLEDRVESGKMWDPTEAVDMVIPILEALEKVHPQGIVHRDLKPDNIFLREGGEIELADFGLAKNFLGNVENPAEVGKVLGTPAYMSPEQAMGFNVEVGPLSDQYSTGAILYTLLNGRTQFSETSSVLHQLRAIAMDELNIPVQLDESLTAVLEKMMAKNQEDRYESVGAARDDLKRWKQGLPTQAEEEQIDYEKKKVRDAWTNRNEMGLEESAKRALKGSAKVAAWQLTKAKRHTWAKKKTIGKVALGAAGIIGAGMGTNTWLEGQAVEIQAEESTSEALAGVAEVTSWSDTTFSSLYGSLEESLDDVTKLKLRSGEDHEGAALMETRVKDKMAKVLSKQVGHLELDYDALRNQAIDHTTPASVVSGYRKSGRELSRRLEEVTAKDAKNSGALRLQQGLEELDVTLKEQFQEAERNEQWRGIRAKITQEVASYEKGSQKSNDKGKQELEEQAVTNLSSLEKDIEKLTEKNPTNFYAQDVTTQLHEEISRFNGKLAHRTLELADQTHAAYGSLRQSYDKIEGEFKKSLKSNTLKTKAVGAANLEGAYHLLYAALDKLSTELSSISKKATKNSDDIDVSKAQIKSLVEQVAAIIEDGKGDTKAAYERKTTLDVDLSHVTGIKTKIGNGKAPKEVIRLVQAASYVNESKEAFEAKRFNTARKKIDEAERVFPNRYLRRFRKHLEFIARQAYVTRGVESIEQVYDDYATRVRVVWAKWNSGDIREEKDRKKALEQELTYLKKQLNTPDNVYISRTSLSKKAYQRRLDKAAEIADDIGRRAQDKLKADPLQDIRRKVNMKEHEYQEDKKEINDWFGQQKELTADVLQKYSRKRAKLRREKYALDELREAADSVIRKLNNDLNKGSYDQGVKKYRDGRAKHRKTLMEKKLKEIEKR